MVKRNHCVGGTNWLFRAEDVNSTHLVSFPDFARWVALSPSKKNRHFEPAIQMCPPCQNFNFIVKVEMMNQDLPAMFKRKQGTWIFKKKTKKNFKKILWQMNSGDFGKVKISRYRTIGYWPNQNETLKVVSARRAFPKLSKKAANFIHSCPPPSSRS